jgi:hypothetical protein
VTTARVLLRPHRIELVASAVLAAVMVAVGAGTVLRMAAFGIPGPCFGGDAGRLASCARYVPGAIQAYSEALQMLLPPAYGATLAVPMIAAVVVGLALVARELEQQTTVLAWSLSPSRVGWLLRRAVPAALGLVVVGLVAGELGDVLEGVRSPTVDPLQSLEQLGARGPSVAAAALLAFGVALLTGAAIARQLPTLLVAGGLIVALLFGVGQLTDAWLRGDSVVDVTAHMRIGDRYLDGMIKTPDGEFISSEEVYARFGADADAILQGISDSVETSQNGFVFAARYVPGELYPIATARITLVAGAIGLLSIAAAALVVNRRRPY